MMHVMQFSTLVFPNPWLECMTFIVAYTIETVIGKGEINDTLIFKHFQYYFHSLLIIVMSKFVLQEWRCF